MDLILRIVRFIIVTVIKCLCKVGESFKILTKDLKEEVVKMEEAKEKEFCIQDDIWPSRKWNKEHTDYIDLSGCIEEVK